MSGFLDEDVNPMFLVAVPQLNDPNFSKSVVLILHHGPDGALGLVVNDEAGLDLGTFARGQELPCHSALQDTPVYRGGPVEPQRCWVLHADSTLEESREILPGLLVSGTVDSLRSLLSGGKGPVRLLLGYAGWGPGQLEAEMAQGSWLTLEANQKTVLEVEAQEAWAEIFRELGIDPHDLAPATGVH